MTKIKNHTLIKAVIFDMDGVLIDAKEWHKDALNMALATLGISISEKDHKNIYDGLPTRRKLEILSQETGFPTSLHSTIERLKQINTIRLAAQRLKPNLEHIKVMRSLKHSNISIGLATNSIRLTSDLFTNLAGLSKYFDSVLTNEDVTEPKPSPEIYLRSCENLEVVPLEVLVFEDNYYGVKSAKLAGCHVVQVNSTTEIKAENVWREIEKRNNTSISR